MKSRTVVTIAVGIAGLVVGGTLARSVSFTHSTSASYSRNTTSTSSPAVQSTGAYVFACVNKSGKIDYLEFRTPLPHQCWFSGESLWHFSAQTAVVASPSPTPTASGSPSTSPSASPTATASPTTTSPSTSAPTTPTSQTTTPAS